MYIFWESKLQITTRTTSTPKKEEEIMLVNKKKEGNKEFTCLFGGKQVPKYHLKPYQVL